MCIIQQTINANKKITDKYAIAEYAGDYYWFLPMLKFIKLAKDLEIIITKDQGNLSFKYANKTLGQRINGIFNIYKIDYDKKLNRVLKCVKADNAKGEAYQKPVMLYVDIKTIINLG